MIRARKLDLAAREWIGVRCLLLRRATSAARGAADAAVGADGGKDGGSGGACMKTSLLHGTAVVNGIREGGVRQGVIMEGGVGRAGVGKAGEEGLALAEDVRGSSAGCSTLVLRPTTTAKGKEVGHDSTAFAATELELDGVLDSSRSGGLVLESPEETADLDNVGMGWGGWGSVGNQKVGGRTYGDDQPHQRDVFFSNV